MKRCPRCNSSKFKTNLENGDKICLKCSYINSKTREVNLKKWSA